MIRTVLASACNPRSPSVPLALWLRAIYYPVSLAISIARVDVVRREAPCYPCKFTNSPLSYPGLTYICISSCIALRIPTNAIRRYTN
ncbi:hypothetical protein [Campylobacter fetus]|uniref:hypothetical protein n=1 Tax=Campylobacter fetus TaxID=196 RepID=UPI0011EA65C1|nr:hypothetical protein [Campylobacter fetus]QMS63600.1 hypothetical protein GZ987_003405 [Campylobacter fetus]